MGGLGEIVILGESVGIWGWWVWGESVGFGGKASVLGGICRVLWESVGIWAGVGRIRGLGENLWGFGEIREDLGVPGLGRIRAVLGFGIDSQSSSESATGSYWELSPPLPPPRVGAP